jgi:ribosomal protein L7/L12
MGMNELVLERLLEATRQLVQKEDLISRLTKVCEAPPSIDPNLFDVEVIMKVMEGYQIEAIKLHRERTGCGLLEAKNALDVLRHRLRVHQEQNQ